MAVLIQILAFVQGMAGKSLLLYTTGWILKKNPKFADEAIPAATLVVNILVAVLAAVTQAATGGVHSVAFAALDPTPAGSNIILDVLLPQIIADGAYNWPRRIWAWLFHHGAKVTNRP